MGYVLTLVYIALALLSPKDLMPSLAEYRVELLVALLAVLFSVPGLLQAKFFRTPQNYLLLGLLAAVFLSVAIGIPWPGGGFVALEKFLPVSIVFFLIVLNCQSIGRLRTTVFVVALVAVFYIVQGARVYYAGKSNINNVCTPNYDEHTRPGRLTKIQGVLEACSPLLDVIPLSDDTFLLRVRGLGFLRDPNDFAQFLVMLIPLIWIRWRRKRYFQNLLFVMVPTAFLIWGMYLTHSRGGIVALVVILVLALKNRVNLLAAALAGVLALGIMTVLDFSGGREISLEAGSNRFMLWGDGLALFKSAPAFGVGYENFANANKGQTAHNSFVVCLAELGLFGYAFWIALLVFTISELNSQIASLSSNKAPPGSGDGDDETPTELDPEKAELRRWAEALRLSLAGFLAAAFFLSRAYALTLFLALGMAVVIFGLASTEDEPAAGQPLWRQLGLSAGVGVASIAFLYVMIRVANALTLEKSGFF
jgi:hypothetical protein